MSLNPLSWIRESVKSAVLAGFGDALAEIDGGPDHASAAVGLREHLRAPLPRPEEPRRPDSLPAPAEPSETHPLNGKGRRRVKEDGPPIA